MLISPTTGDLAGGIEVARLKNGFLGTEHPGVFFNRPQLTVEDPESLGFVRASALTGSVPVPIAVEGVGVDLSTRHDVDILDHRLGSAGVRRVAGGVFTDPHPDTWWDTIHQSGRIVVFVGDISLLFADRFTEGLLQTYMCQMPLAIHAWGSGVGSRHPGQ